MSLNVKRNYKVNSDLYECYLKIMVIKRSKLSTTYCKQGKSNLLIFCRHILLYKPSHPCCVCHSSTWYVDRLVRLESVPSYVRAGRASEPTEVLLQPAAQVRRSPMSGAGQRGGILSGHARLPRYDWQNQLL